MQFFLTILLCIHSLLFFGCTSKKDSLPKLVIYTHSSFQGSYGPGPELKSIFESKCNCQVELINAGDAGILLQRLRLEKNQSADLIVGLDQLSLLDANQVEWKKLKTKVGLRDELKSWNNAYFLPYDWSPMTFLHIQGSTPVAKTFDDLLDPRYKRAFSMQDPRFSTPGLQFLLWVLHVKGEKEGFEFLKKFKKNIYKISPSWSTSYGLFQKQKAKSVFSYFTSAVYHWSFKKDKTVQPFVIKEGHPIQLELLAIPKNCNQCQLAEDFAKLMVSPQGQKVLLNKNYMLPVIDGVSQGTLFEQLPKMKTFFLDSKSEWIVNKQKILKKWYKSMGG